MGNEGGRAMESNSDQEYFFIFLGTIFYFIDYSDLFDRSVVSWMSAGWRGGL